MSARLYGDWESIQPKIKITAATMNKRLVKVVEALGEEYIKRVRGHIDKQDLGLFPLALATILKKKDHKSGWWFETGKFKDKLTVRKYYQGIKTASVIAGALGVNVYEKGITMYRLASWLEYGTKNIVGRPLFTMTLMEIEKLDVLKKVGAEIKIIWDSPAMFIK